MRISESNARFKQLMQGNKHTQHAMEANKKWWKERLKEDIRGNLILEFGFDLWGLPICGRCEGYALWHKGDDGSPVGYCQCGHITKNPITVEQYYEQQLNTDRSIHRNAPTIAERQIVLPNQVVDIDNQKIIAIRRH